MITTTSGGYGLPYLSLVIKNAILSPQSPSVSDRSQSGASSDPSPRCSAASDFLSQISTYDWIIIARPVADFYPANVKSAVALLRVSDDVIYEHKMKK